MARIKLEIPEKFIFKTELSVRITDLNYGGHLGNDSVLRLIHESRVRFFKSLGYDEKNVANNGIIMADSVIVYKSEAFYGDQIQVGIAVDEFYKVGCDIFYHLINSETAKEIARAKTGIVFFDYQRRKKSRVPLEFIRAVEELKNV